MTREEAKQILQRIIKDNAFRFHFSEKLALGAGIEALEQLELIRCKNCQYCKDYGMGGLYCESEDIVPVGNYVEPDGFCNFWEWRREE